MPTPKNNAVEPMVVVVEVRGRRITVSDPLASKIAYLAENAEFFNDPRTLGTVALNLKDKNIQLKTDANVAA